MQKYAITLSDGSEHIVKPDLRDKIGAETYFRNHKSIGSIADNPMRYSAFLAWSAGYRSGAIEVPWDQFLDAKDPEQLHALDVEFYTDDDETDDETNEVEGLGEGMSADLPLS